MKNTATETGRESVTGNEWCRYKDIADKAAYLKICCLSRFETMHFRL